MKSLFNKIVIAISEDMGVPARLKELLADSPELCVPIIAPQKSVELSSSVVRWHTWGELSNTLVRNSKPGLVNGWQRQGNKLESLTIEIAELAALGAERSSLEFSCDIQDIVGLSASKSELTEYHSLDAMVLANAPSYLEDLTEQSMKAHLQHRGVNIFNAGGPDFLKIHLWDGRIFLVNDNGSHHFAAARYIAARIGMKVQIQAKLVVATLSFSNIVNLRKKFDLFAISNESGLLNGFFDAMESFQASFYWHPMPRPYDKVARAILLPKTDDRSRKVAEVLSSAGAFNIGDYLELAALKQVEFETKIRSINAPNQST